MDNLEYSTDEAVAVAEAAVSGARSPEGCTVLYFIHSGTSFEAVCASYSQ